MKDIQVTIISESIKFIFGAVLLFITWGFGQKIIATWDAKKKRQEFDIATSTQFQHVYGDVKQVNKLWRIYIRSRNSNASSDHSSLFPDEKRWEILQKAVEVESRMEAIIVKLSTERELTEDEIRSLGLLRQVIQQLREDIRDNEVSTFVGVGSGYNLLNAMACNVAHIISKGKHSSKITTAQARDNLKSIAKIGSKALKDEASKTEYQNAYRLNDNEGSNNTEVDNSLQEWPN